MKKIQRRLMTITLDTLQEPKMRSNRYYIIHEINRVISITDPTVGIDQAVIQDKHNLPSLKGVQLKLL